MSETIPSAFLSYTNNDDRQESGKLRHLAKLLEGEVEVRLGSRFELFVDKEKLGWGEPWKKRIAESLENTLFLIPILTPWYFNSPACREEFDLFRRREEQLKRDDLILPLYYIDCPLIDDPARAEKDEIARVIASRQIVDWREWRHTRLEDLRPQVDKIARQLVIAINRRDGARYSPPSVVTLPRVPASPDVRPIASETDRSAPSVSRPASPNTSAPVEKPQTQQEDHLALATRLYSKGRYREAVTLFQSAAEAGDGVAMYNLGAMLERGLGGSVDLPAAKAWYESAADAGVPEALNSLGTLFEFGRGVLENRNEARLWYERAAAAGNTAGAANLLRIAPLAGK